MEHMYMCYSQQNQSKKNRIKIKSKIKIVRTFQICEISEFWLLLDD
jgi:hypothetical protein